MTEADFSKCLICDTIINAVPYFKISSCNHEFCAQCLCKYLETFNTANIKCPLEHCIALIPDRIIRKCLSDLKAEIYDKLCYPLTAVKCLFADCSYFVASEEHRGHFICPFCKQPNCITCSDLHEVNEPCGSSLRRKLYEERARINLVEKRRLDLLEMRKDNCLDINPESSECLNCTDFLLPREGILVIPCMHNFCRKCLQGHLNEVKQIDKLTCLGCKAPLEDGQLRELIGIEKLQLLSLQNVELFFFHCQTPDCKSFWDQGDCKSFHTCKICQKKNCIPCLAIHEGQSCEEFKKSDAFKKRQKEIDTIKKQNAINCYNCNNLIVKSDGCGALNCNVCGKQVCAYSGKALGPEGCNCTSTKTCHKDCIYGCIPEGESKEEKELKDYFNNN